MAQQYEPDEFDQIAQEGGPVGVHRAPRPWWSRLLPPLLAFLIAGLITLAIAVVLWNRDIVSPEPAPTPTVTVPPIEEPATTPEPTEPEEAIETPAPEDPEPEPTATEEPEPEILYDVQIHVRNGASIQGLAGSQQEILEEAGYTNIEANNISVERIPDGENVVAYLDERLADTVQDIADTLGIEAIYTNGTPGGAEIEVLLATDPGA